MDGIKLCPSILSADFSNLKKQIDLVEKAGANYVHVDVMDGHFVKNLTFGIPIVESLAKFSNLPLDVHLMVSQPINYIESFYRAGASTITFHFESESSLIGCVEILKRLNCKAALAIKPSTEVEEIEQYLDFFDMILVMTVEPGFGGQKLILDMLKKVEKLKKLRPNLNIQVDGGVNFENVELVCRAGANFIVVGSLIFKSANCFNETLKFRNIFEKLA